MALDWDYVGETEKTKVKKYVKLAAKTAKEHKKHFGSTDDEHEEARDKVSNKMKKSLKDGVRYQKLIMTKYKNEDVAIFFQKMKWLSEFAHPNLGPIWIISLAFEQEGKIFKKPGSGGVDQDYIDFLEELNHPAGPLHGFMGDHGVRSLFSVGPVAGPDPDRDLEISWLELVAEDIWVPSNGTWTIQPPITIDDTYAGYDTATSTYVDIPQEVLDHWGWFSSGRFDLTEAEFSR
jgi:hypothetical protein